MGRLRFVKAATVSGWHWLVEISNHVSAVAALVAVLGVSVYSSVTLPHWWYGALILCAAYVVLFGEGAFRVWRETNEQLAAAAPTVTRGLIEHSAYKGRLKKHHALGRERLRLVEAMQVQRGTAVGGPDFEKFAIKDAQRQEATWTEETRQLLEKSQELAEHFDNPATGDAPGFSLVGSKLDQIVLRFRWRIDRLGEMIEWLTGAEADQQLAAGRTGYRGRKGSRANLRGARFGSKLDTGIENEGDVEAEESKFE
jgi:hypothetical protein